MDKDTLRGFAAIHRLLTQLNECAELAPEMYQRDMDEIEAIVEAHGWNVE